MRFKVKKIVKRSDGRQPTPNPLCPPYARRRRCSKGLRMRLAEFALKMSYGDTCIEFETAMDVHKFLTRL